MKGMNYIFLLRDASLSTGGSPNAFSHIRPKYLRTALETSPWILANDRVVLFYSDRCRQDFERPATAIDAAGLFLPPVAAVSPSPAVPKPLIREVIDNHSGLTDLLSSKQKT